jgi:lysophospholipase L1-like esterase
MAQILCFGASSTYGVGGQDGGWPDYLKRDLHAQQFVDHGSGEKHEVYNLAKPGITIEFVAERLSELVSAYGRKTMPLVLAFSFGGNNALALNEPTNFVCTPEEYATKLRVLLQAAKQHTEYVLITGINPVNEAILNPKKNPWNNDVAYFFNDRQELFDGIISKVANEENVVCVPLYKDAVAASWSETYQWIDGLHPNTRGHAYMYHKVEPAIKSFLAALE